MADKSVRWQPLAERNWHREQEAAASQSSVSQPVSGAQTPESGTSAPSGRIPPVIWAADKDSPDYSHLTAFADLTGKPFELTAADLEQLANANRFRLAGDGERPVVFALRGALLAEDEVIGADALQLIDARPDHKTFRCVIGYWHQRTRKLSAFRASTVANVKFMTNYYLWNNGLGGSSSVAANLALTGCYVYRVGAHAGGKIYPALRLTSPDNLAEDGSTVVLRTRNDLRFDTTDLFDAATPYNNIHTAYAYDAFSSAGNLTIKGPNGEGPWGSFQALLKTMKVNTRIDVMLLTGLEAAGASVLRKTAKLTDRATMCDRLIRLRQGSHGDAVTRLQTALGLQPSGYMGTNTAKRLADLQMAKLGLADAIYSPPMDRLLGFNVLGPECRE